jgi:TolB protein
MKKINYIILLFSILSIMTFSSHADEGLTIVAIGEAKGEVAKILIDGPYLAENLTPNQLLLSKDIKSIFKNDFSFYKKLFKVELKEDFQKTFEDSIKFEAQKTAGNNIVIKFLVSSEGVNDLKMKVVAWSIDKKVELLSLEIVLSKRNLRNQIHSASDQIFKKITGKDSIFKSKIYFVSDKHSSRRNIIKELYSMDFDGRNKTRLTFHRGTVISPAISYDKKLMVYSLIPNKISKHRNVNLYLFNFETKKHRLLSSRRGINSGAVFTPNGKHILLTLSFGGNAEIYSMNILTKATRRITRHFKEDVDPSINRNGSLLTFLSGRSGKAMIYTSDPTGLEKQVKRISYVGQYNATPRFNPMGDQIVFSSWLDERFDLFRINADGTGLSRLTKDFGSNEDPTYSNDGEFIAFSSQRVLSRTKATHNIYIMDKNGDIIGNLTKNFGNCITPRWSKELKL